MDERIVNLADLALRAVGDGKAFQARVGQAGPRIGSSGLGVSLVIVPPGKSACPFHRHHVWHELFFVLEGEGVVRLDGETRPIRAGDLIAAPAGGEAHQIVNTGQTDLRYLAMSADSPTDVIEYPDSGKVAVDAGMTPFDAAEPSLSLFGRVVETEYYDSQEESPAGASKG